MCHTPNHTMKVIIVHIIYFTNIESTIYLPSNTGVIDLIQWQITLLHF